MFSTVKRIIDWCGSFKKNLYIGFIFFLFFRLVCGNAGRMGCIYDREACRMRRTGKSCLNGLDWEKYRNSAAFHLSAFSV